MLNHPTLCILRGLPHRKCHLTRLLKLRHRCNRGSLCGQIYKTVCPSFNRVHRSTISWFPRSLIADFRRIAIMPSQRNYLTTLISGVVPLDWRRRNLLPSWMISRMCAFAPDTSVIAIELMCLIGRSGFPRGSIHTSISRARKVVARIAVRVVAVLCSPIANTHRFATRRGPESQR